MEALRWEDEGRRCGRRRGGEGGEWKVVGSGYSWWHNEDGLSTLIRTGSIEINVRYNIIGCDCYRDGRVD